MCAIRTYMINNLVIDEVALFYLFEYKKEGDLDGDKNIWFQSFGTHKI